MDFRFSEEQDMLRNTVREFLKKECPRELVRKWDDESRIPDSVIEKLKGLGILGLYVPVAYGGMGGTPLDYSIVLEELGRVSVGLATYYVECVIYGGAIIQECGSENQKQNFLPRIARGELTFSFGITEPDSGSDAAAAKTTATRNKEGNYILNGVKMFITGADKTDYVVTLARTDKDVPKHKGLTLFLVDTKSKGYSAKPIRKLGGAESACEVVYDNVLVPQDNMLGGLEGLNNGWKLLLRTLELEHIELAAISLGIAQAAFDDALEYAKTREQFGQPIGKFQAISHMLAEMFLDLHLARLATYNSAWLKSQNLPCYTEICMAKLCATETATRIAMRAMEIYGGYGYMMDNDVQRYLRESLIPLIGGGTKQIQKNMIARALGL